MNNQPNMPALEVNNLTVYYRDVCVLSDITMSISQGQMVGIIGPNGAGKTTLLKALLGIVPVTSGTVSIVGDRGAARKNIGYVPQQSTVDWDFPLTVFDMVLMGCYGRLGWFRRPTQEDRIKTKELIAFVGLQDAMHNPISTLSGGQRQRAFIARALLQDAQVYFLDEPFAGVDIVTEKIIIDIFKQLCAEGKTVIVVHHDLITAPFYFTWALLLHKKVIANGPIREVLTPENVARMYGLHELKSAWLDAIMHKEKDV